MSAKAKTRATAFAPATVGNAAVGFDILGFATESVGDKVTVRRIPSPTVEIGQISGVVTELPRDPRENTATVGLVQLINDLGLDFGFAVDIEKGIPLGSGMGGSAASAVGAIVAAAALVDEELSTLELLDYALAGESVASGSAHGDNVTPCLMGGLTLTRSLSPLDVIDLPVPDGVYCVLVKPDIRIDTRHAREVIPAEFPLKIIVEQSANLAGFISGCYRNDLELIGRSLFDVLIEPHRASLIPGFDAVREAALDKGALGASISGSGPSVFALCDGKTTARAVENAMVLAFTNRNVTAKAWTAPISRRGAYIIDDF